MFVKVNAAAVHGIDAIMISVEVNTTTATKFMLVGLPDNAVKESYERIMSAVKHLSIPFPRKMVVVNMAPADIRKEGSAYDLPIAIGVLASNEIVDKSDLDKYVFMGELSLDGTLNPIKGALPIAILARELGFKGLVLPKANTPEAAVVNNLDVYSADNLRDVVDFLNHNKELEKIQVDTRKEFYSHTESFDIDFADVKGQESVKRALEVSAAGGHNLIMIGAPGAGKSMMAKRIPTILPPLTLNEALETTKIHSVAGKINGNYSLIAQRPFRSPHHTISDVALVGGGTFPQPGEISLAHNGVLFLDELPEFKRTVLEVMRQPLEDRKISISRAKFAAEYPASFMLVASMNPCPCGYYNHPEKMCVCAPGMVQKYLGRISGPLLDRIDMHIEIVPVPFEKLSDDAPVEKSEVIRKRVIDARNIQQQRFENSAGIYCNAQMTSKMLREFAVPNQAGQELLKMAMLKMNLSARAHGRILKVARTIADLEASQNIEVHHLAEAINYRSLDREGWAG
ncbi:MAG: YifB family Mg chelatase-like AAA ATPase [Prevotellaceae bacterium]|jgi:magnesium chelatase family protein|nr:YifB family Mg chelatase-like AAA ATPase [Prevotellaceae bacterium]